MKSISALHQEINGYNRSRKILAVVAAEDKNVLYSVTQAYNKGIIDAILFGNRKNIEQNLEDLGADVEKYFIVETENSYEAAQKAVQYVTTGRAEIIMKGLIDSGTFMRALLDKKYGLRTPGTIISSIAIVEIFIEDRKRLLFITDPGFIPLPDLETKKKIIENAVIIMHYLGIKKPKVAVLSAMENVNPKIISSYEGKILEEMNQKGDISGCIVGGPFSLDLAISKLSADHKAFHHPVAGNADLILVPSLEVGNVLLKSITYFAKSPTCGVVAGTKAPVVFTSRSDSAQTKLNTIMLAVLLIERGMYGRKKV